MPLGQLGMLAIGVLLLVVVIRLLLKPLRCLGKLVLHIVFGFISLFVFNFLAAFSAWRWASPGSMPSSPVFSAYPALFCC